MYDDKYMRGRQSLALAVEGRGVEMDSDTIDHG